ncbi:MAG: ABC transporter permease [Sphingobacteriales bacterium]|nr:MAG: ABC transporter permease [Sphingobacteriales bacterium]
MDFYLSAILQGLCLSAMAFGIFISMKIFNIPDISTDGTYTLGGVISGFFISQSYNSFAIVGLVTVGGALAGAATGFIHTKLKVNALLAGILVMTALYSINLSILGQSNLPLLNFPTLFTVINVFQNPTQNTFLIVATIILILLIMVSYVLKSDFGLAMRATGNSQTMVRALGVNTDNMKIIGLAIANALTALSGYLMTQLQGFADINMGIGIVIVGLGSVIMGETLINYFAITSVVKMLLTVILGAIVFQLVLAFALSLGINPNLLKLITAAFVLLIVGLPRFIFKKAE